MNTNVQPPSKYSIIGFALLFAVPLLPYGGYQCWYSIRVWSEHEHMKSWVEVPATIKTAKLRSHRGRGGYSYDVLATYEYEFQGQRFIGDRVTLFRGYRDLDDYNHDAFKVIESHRKDQTSFRCYVNPDSPREAISFRNVPGSLLVLQALVSVMPGTIGVGVATLALTILLFSLARPNLRGGSPIPGNSQVPTAEESDPRNLSTIMVILAIGVYWCVASLPLVQKIIECVANGGSNWAWPALIFPVIGIYLVVLSLRIGIRNTLRHSFA